jgi:muconolactone D-isomerase
MEFLVCCELDLGTNMSPEREVELRSAEAVRAAELARGGKLRRLWRVPGRNANFGLWEAGDATELHKALSSLPMFPWMRIRVEPLAQHPNDPATGGAKAAAA